jgi:tRNA (guanine-N7-)-methyltransferase
MGKDKLQRFAENETFDFLFQPRPHEMYKHDFFLKGKWNSAFFKNDNPITLEIGCGKGEYTTGMAQMFPNRNFIGIDYKGARLWRGCKTTQEKSLTNVAFIRNKIEFLNAFFGEDEISEIWITFPDPQIKKDKKKLSSERFLNIYKTLLQKDGKIFLKTDSVHLYDFTQELIKLNDIPLIFASKDIYGEKQSDRCYNIQTFYEKQFLAEDKKITLTEFILEKNKEYINPPRKPRKKQKPRNKKA